MVVHKVPEVGRVTLVLPVVVRVKVFEPVPKVTVPVVPAPKEVEPAKETVLVRKVRVPLPVEMILPLKLPEMTALLNTLGNN